MATINFRTKVIYTHVFCNILHSVQQMHFYVCSLVNDTPVHLKEEEDKDEK